MEIVVSGASPMFRSSGGGVVAIVYPIHAIIPRIIATPRNAVICTIRVVILAL